MSPELCPFCGKSYKRLKSHLPYCKAAKPPLSHHEPLASASSGRLEADSSKKKGKTTQSLSEKASPEVPGKRGQTSTMSKPKKKSIHTIIEVAKSSQISPGSDSALQSLETVLPRGTTTKSKSKDYLSAESPKPQSASKKKQIKSPEKDIMAERKEMPRITLQHVGSTLGRAKTSRPAIHIETTQTNTKSSPDLSPASTSIITQPKESLLLHKEDSYGSKATPFRPSLLTDLQSSKVGFHQTELTAVLPGHLPNLHSKPKDTFATLERRKDNSSGRSLGQVTLRELPEWLACRTPRHPGHAVQMMQRGWQWYYRKYIDVRKGGVGGLGMLLAGYCVLSYVWCYPHLKHERWRKYH